ncbi:MAG: vitamin K epoxide reductase family protein [Gemmatimonadaceae bacterium]
MSKRMLAAALALAGVFVSLYLTLYKVGVIGQLSCSVGSCEAVNTSEWSTLLGQPVALWGLGFYVATFAVAVAGLGGRFLDSRAVSLLLTAMAGTGVLFSAWLTYLELFVIHAICMWCVISAIIVTLIFALSLLDLREVGGGGDAIDAPGEVPARG